MGYLREKYSKDYYIHESKQGECSQAGVAGIEEFRNGTIRAVNQNILCRIDLKNKNVLDIGCGRGEVIKYIYEQGARSVTGVDFSEDAIAIASDFHKQHGIDSILHCEDAVTYAKNFVNLNQDQKRNLFDIIIMFDFVEHVPRLEMGELLGYLKNMLVKRGLIAVRTPHFGVDNDVIKEGLKLLAIDGTEDKELTNGMHCNRYTRDSLKGYMMRYEFFPISHHLFIVNSPMGNIFPMASKKSRNIAFKMGYPIHLPLAHRPESYEGYSWKRIAIMRPIRLAYLLLKYRSRAKGFSYSMSG